MRVHGTAVAHSRNLWGKVPKVRFAHAISSLATCDMVRCAASKFALCQLAQPKLATRALLACFRTSGWAEGLVPAGSLHWGSLGLQVGLQVGWLGKVV